MNPNAAPDTLFCLTSDCPNCPAMLQILSDMVKRGTLGRLEVVNLNARPDVAAALGIRSVPWLRVGRFELTGLHGRETVQRLIERASSPTGMADHLHDLLREGDLAQVLDMVRHDPTVLADLLPIVANPEASINVRIGAGAVFEEFAGLPAIRALVGKLGGLASHADPRVRADACHYLSLTGSEAAAPYLADRLKDDDATVREIAAESLEMLGAGEPPH